MQDLRLLSEAVARQEDLACRIIYRSRSGVVTRRAISPIKMGATKLTAMCLSSGMVKSFSLCSIENVVLVRVDEIFAPEEMSVEKYRRWKRVQADRRLASWRGGRRQDTVIRRSPLDC